MLSLKRIIALSLSLLLTGQSLVFAAAPTDNPQTLAQHQQRAKQDVQNAPWIQREGKYLLGFGGATAVALIAQNVIHRRIQKQNWSHWQALYQQDLAELGELRLDNSLLRMQNRSLAWQTAEDQRLIQELRQGSSLPSGTQNTFGWGENRFLTKKAKGRPFYLNISSIEKLERANAELQRRLEANGKFNEVFFGVSAQLEKEMEKYTPLFDRKSTEQTRQALMEQLRNEAWLKKWPKARQKEFLTTVRTAAELSRSKWNHTTSARLLAQTSKINSKIPYYLYLTAMAKSLFRSSNLFIVGFALTLGFLTPATAKAQRTAQRINENFDLFLTATPQQLAELEKNKETKEACLAVSEVLHTLSLMTQEEVESYVLEGQHQERTARMQRTRNRAR